ncbi:hypothetical protein JW977_01035, partial [Candidatus Falkowbacteria bacterium]|nr:hypothetical protein [Candidatus Falkowbacteria bacterium]
NNLEPRAFLKEYLDNWQIILRDVLIMKNNLEDLMINMQFKKELDKINKKFSTQKIIDLLAELNEFKKYLNYNINPRLAAENLIINF